MATQSNNLVEAQTPANAPSAAPSAASQETEAAVAAHLERIQKLNQSLEQVQKHLQIITQQNNQSDSNGNALLSAIASDPLAAAKFNAAFAYSLQSLNFALHRSEAESTDAVRAELKRVATYINRVSAQEEKIKQAQAPTTTEESHSSTSKAQ